MPATWPSSGSFDAAQWEARMARSTVPAPAQPAAQLAAPPAVRRVIPAPPGDHAPLPPLPLLTNPYSERLRRASRLLRNRLNYLEDPPVPLSERAQRLLSHQTSRLSRSVERLLIASKRYEEEHRLIPHFAEGLPAA